MKISHIIKIQLIIITGIILTCSCISDVDYGEQYKKTIYLVNSNNLLYQAEHFYGEENAMVFSVYCASSQPIESDVTIQLRFDKNSLDSLNESRAQSDPEYISKELLPQTNYELPSDPIVTIEAGEQYGTLHVPFTTDNLDPFTSYALPLSIVSNSLEYDINHKLSTIVYEPVMINKYSGNYTGISSESETIARPVVPSIKALSINTVCMPIHNLPGDIKNIDSNFMLLTINENNMTVSITPIGNANVVDLGGSFYDEERMTFELHYQLEKDDGTILTIKEIIVHVDAPVVEEDVML